MREPDANRPFWIGKQPLSAIRRKMAYVRDTHVQMVSSAEFLSEYTRAGGCVPSGAQIDLYQLWRTVFAMHFILVARIYVRAHVTTSMIAANGAEHLYTYHGRALNETLHHVHQKDL